MENGKEEGGLRSAWSLIIRTQGRADPAHRGDQESHQADRHHDFPVRPQGAAAGARERGHARRESARAHRAHDRRRTEAAPQARARDAERRRHGIAHRRRPAALSLQDAAHRPRYALHAGVQLHAARHREEPHDGGRHQEQGDCLGSDQAVRGRLDAPAVHGEPRQLSRQPRERAHRALAIHQEREERAADLRHEGQRSADDQAAAGPREGGRRRPHHRQSRQERRGADGREDARTCACTCGRCCATVRRCFSAA